MTTEDNTTYDARSYYDGDFIGLEDRLGFTPDKTEMQYWVHDKISRGFCVTIVKDICGIETKYYINPDDYWEDFNGEFPYPEI